MVSSEKTDNLISLAYLLSDNTVFRFSKQLTNGGYREPPHPLEDAEGSTVTLLTSAVQEGLLSASQTQRVCGNTTLTLAPIHSSHITDVVIDVMQVLIEGQTVTERVAEGHKFALRLLEMINNEGFFVTADDLQAVRDLVPSLNTLKYSDKRFDLRWNSMAQVLGVAPNLKKELLGVRDEIVAIETKAASLRAKYRTKARWLHTSLLKGVKYMNHDNYLYLNSAVSELEGHHLFLFIRESFNPSDILNSYNYFIKLKESKKFNGTFHIVDLDVEISSDAPSAIPDSTKIRHLIDGVWMSDDVIKDLDTDPVNNLIEHSGAVSGGLGSRDKRTLLNLPCPQCRGRPVRWSCSKCLCIFEYCFDNALHCNCGTVSSTLKFRCGNYYHREFATDYRKYTLGHLKHLQPTPQVNILLIGQSGVGKSTWINGLVNSLRFDSLDGALAEEPITLIPGQFTIYDSDGREHRVVVGNDTNEASSVGVSATQMCRTYVVYYRGLRVTLIDTPGLGDTRGPSQDLDNVRDILQILSLFPKLHAICFLLLPDEPRLHAPLRYSILETLSFYHQSVLGNLFFVFTHGRGTSYRVGNSLPLLQTLMEQSRIDFKLGIDRAYVFDNEAYRFLCAKKKTAVQFEADVEAMFEESWRKSSLEFSRLISFASELTPYESKKTLDMGIVRLKMLSVMSAVLDASNLQSTESLNEEIERCEKKIELLQQTKVKSVTVKEETVALRVVCASPTCIKVEGGANIYNQECSSTCPVSTRIKVLPNVELRSLPELATGTCTRCRCRWEKHMVIDFRQTVVEKMVFDPTVQSEISKAKVAKEQYLNRIEAIEDDAVTAEKRRNSLETFARVLAKYFAQHSFFLYNDAVEDYLKYLIETGETKAEKTDLDKLRIMELKKLKEKTKEVARIVETMRNVNYVRTRGEVFMTVEELMEKEKNANLKLEKEKPIEEKVRPEYRVYLS